jgi:type II secretory ATPase GspE/PulE/Tfp pilus assembly ATPase PilB-like protein
MDYSPTARTIESLFQRMQSAEHLEDIIWELEQEMLEILQAERITIYRKDKNEIVSWYKSGDDVGEEIRLPLSPSSLAGFVAMSQKPVLIEDVYDAEQLSAYHPDLAFDYTYDQASGFLTSSMVIVPIQFSNTLLGVMQLINKTDGSVFTKSDLTTAKQVSDVLGERFRYDLKTTVGPFDHLIRSGKMTLEELEEMEAIAAKEKLPVTLMMTRHLEITGDEIGQSLEQYYQVPFFRYDPTLEIHNEYLDNLNMEYLASNMWVPLAGNPEKAIILIDDPNDSDRIMEIQNVIHARTYEFMVGLAEDILKYLGFELDSVEEITEPELDMNDLLCRLEEEQGLDGEDDVEDMDDGASTIVQLVNRIIFDGLNLDASDIHLEPEKRAPMRVRMRVDGECREVLTIPKTHARAVISRVKIMSRLDIAEKRLPQSGKMTVRVGSMRLELRVETVPTVKGEGAVLRILASGEPLPFAKLNLSPRNEEMIEEILTHPHGICLVVGPTGSGKTTSLHAILGHINKVETKIWTAEDPVEITQAGLCQVQAQPKIGLTFEAILRSFLRADPDIILIGEMRDKETSHAGVEASLTGHLVFSTLHTNSAPETITRLLDMGLDPMNFADALIGVVAQRLLRTLCGECKEEYKPDDAELQKLVHFYGEEYFDETGINLSEVTLMRPVGCTRCGDSGYRGRTGVHEVLTATEELKKLIVEQASVAVIQKQAIKDGLRTLQQDGIWKIFKGDSTLDQLRKITSLGH